MADLLAFCPHCQGAGHVPASETNSPWVKVYGEFSGDTEVFGERLDTTATELPDDHPDALDAFGVPMRRGDWAMHVAGVDRSQVPQRTLHPARIVALARLTVRSRTRTYHDAKPSLIAREGWNVRPPHHIEFEACWCQWTARGVLAWAKGEAFSPADAIVALNAVETRARFDPMHQRALRRFLDAMVVRKLLVAAGRGRYRAAEGGSRG